MMSWFHHHRTLSSSSSNNDARIEEMIKKMSFSEKVGQLSQIDLSLLLEDDADTNSTSYPKFQLNLEKVQYYFGKLGIGSVLNNVVGQAWTMAEFREAAIAIQNAKNAPRIVWGLDSVHGGNYFSDGVFSPQPINVAATFDVSLARAAAKLARDQTAAAGISWLFSPLVGIALEPKWSRVYETFGEDPLVVGTMADAYITSIQTPITSPRTSPSRTAACGKHFAGYSMPRDGHDRGPSWIPKRHLYQYFVPPWKRITANAFSIMESYTEVDGVPNVANRETTWKLLRQTLQFDGVLVTDYSELLNLYSWHSIKPDNISATIYGMQQTSIDMSMIPINVESFETAMKEGYETKMLSDTRIDDSVRRVLKFKQKLGLLGNDNNNNDDPLLTMENAPPFDRDAAMTAAMNMTLKGIILAKNDNGALPLDNNSPLQILITGPSANSLAYQSGGWTLQWQGAPSDSWFSYGTTVLQAFLNETLNAISYSCGVDIHGNNCQDILAPDDNNDNQFESLVNTVEDWIGIGGNDDDSSIQRAANAASGKDVIVVCVGEENYAEKPGDILDLALPQGQYDLVRTLSQHKSPNAKLIVVYFGGRPRLLQDMVDLADAVILAFLPGPLAGSALVELMTGRENFSGRLPITYPKYNDNGGIPYFHAVSDMCTQTESPMESYVPCQVEWPFGHGLGYTTFRYSQLTLNTQTLVYKTSKNNNNQNSDSLTISIQVTNTGSVAGWDTIFMFTFDEFRSTTPEYKRLRHFEKVYLEPHETTTVTSTLHINQFKFVGPHDSSHYILEHGLKFNVGIGADVDCRMDSTNVLCSNAVTIDAGEDYIAACEAACDLWNESLCAPKEMTSWNQCWDLCTKASPEAPWNDGWGWNYVECLENVMWDMQSSDDCWKMTTHCRNILGTSSSSLLPIHHHDTPAPGGWSMLVAFTVGGLASIAVVRLIYKGGLFRSDTDNNHDVQFAPLNNTVVE